MSIGLGLVLAAIIVSLTLLYINRRNDSRVHARATPTTKPSRMKRLLLILLSVISFLFLLFAVDVLYVWIANMPRTQYSYQGIKLGASMKEVRYIKGMPWKLSKEKTSLGLLTEDPDEIVAGDSIFNYPMWYLREGSDAILLIDFDQPNGKVVAVSCFQIPIPDRIIDPFACESLSGIQIGMPENSLKAQLGIPDSETIDDNMKQIVFKKYNARFILERQQVYYIELKDPEWVEGSNLTVKQDGSDPSAAKPDKPFDPDAHLKERRSGVQGSTQTP